MNIQKDIGQWAAKTFELQNVDSKIEHLMREVKELQAYPTDRLEMADCAILLFGIAELQGVDLLEAVNEKMKINKKREWNSPDELGVYKHKETNDQC